jgi:hypothetical protein
MNLRTLNARHIRLIAMHWSRNAVRSGSGLVYLLIALVFGLSVAHMLIMPVEQLMIAQKREIGRTDPNAISELIITVGKPIAQFILGVRSMEEIAAQNAASPAAAGVASFDPWTGFLLEDQPALLSAIFLILVFGMPFAISFLAFNQVSGDIQTHGLRYLLLRTKRGNIYFGRFLGTCSPPRSWRF